MMMIAISASAPITLPTITPVLLDFTVGGVDVVEVCCGADEVGGEDDERIGIGSKLSFISQDETTSEMHVNVRIHRVIEQNDRRICIACPDDVELVLTWWQCCIDIARHIELKCLRARRHMFETSHKFAI